MRPGSTETRTLINNAGSDPAESCGICGDTGLVDHDDGDAYGCTFCGIGAAKTAKLRLRSVYAVNDIYPAVRRPGLKLDIAEYAQTPAGRKDPHLDRVRDMVIAARRAKKEKASDTDDRHAARHLPTVAGRSPSPQRVLRRPELDAGGAAPVDGERPEADHRGEGEGEGEVPLAGNP